MYSIGDIIAVTDEASASLYDTKRRPGRPTYEQFAQFWDPIVAELDAVLWSLT